MENISQIEIDGVEIEETEDESPVEVPLENRRVQTDKQDIPIDTLKGWIERGKINLQPNFQRYYVWDGTKESRLIESVLLEIPLPVIYIAEEENKNYSVVDGQQRLTSIHRFLKGDFKLTNLQILKELIGKTFVQLSPEQQETILSASLRIIIIQKNSNENVKFEMFERLNVGAVKLNDQELRNCVYHGEYNQLLKELCENQHLQKILGLNAPHQRMADRQLILRFFAMWRNTHLKYKAPVKSFLNNEMLKHRNPSAKEIEEMREVFEKSIEMAFSVFGKSAFRRYYVGKNDNPNGKWEETKLNVALWDTILYGFSFFEKSQVIPIADSVREEFLDLLAGDEKFVEYIITTGDKPDRVQYRADAWLQRLRSLISEVEPRNFSKALKEKLFESDATCKICEQKIYDVDDAEVDHIKHYWRGGRTVDENARLTHRFCNRSRGGRD